MLTQLLRSLLNSIAGLRRSRSQRIDETTLRQRMARVQAALLAGELASARGLADELIALAPAEADAHLLHGVVLLRSALPRAALESISHALALRPDFADARLQFAIAHHELGNFDAAIENLGDLAKTFPDDLRIQLWLADTYHKVERYEESARALQRAIELEPGRAEAHASLAHILLTRLERQDDALVHSSQAMRCNPSLALARLNHALVLQSFGRFDEAESLYATLQGDPLEERARYNASLIRLGRGELGAAWDDYEARRAQPDFVVYGPQGIPDWNGESLEGRTIVAYWEQGLGDEIMFASCLPDLTRISGLCVIHCSPRLESLFRRSFPGAQVLGASLGAPSSDQADFRVAFGSLPRRFRRCAQDYPRHSGYLMADPDRTAHWRERLAAEHGAKLKVGISWRGGLPHTRRSLRSFELEALVPLLQVQTAAFVSLQYGEVEDEIDRIIRHRDVELAHYDDAMTDYDETAALVSALDVVITVCTAVAHLSGALARPVWVLVPHVAEWRYRQAGEEMVWYPTARLLRAPAPGNWDPVLQEAIRSLTALMKENRNDPLPDVPKSVTR